VVEYTLGGQRRELSAQEVERTAAGIEPGPIRTHAVRVGGMLFPVKQIFGAAAHIDIADFTTNQARRILKRLGFEVVRI
jgi:hypothetical protein